MIFTKALFASVSTLVLSLTPTLALALSSLSFEPSSSTGVVGDTIMVDLVWDGTGGMAPTYLGDFDLDVSYDPSIVSFLGGIIDPDLGVDSFGCFDCAVDGSTAGTVNLFEISFDSVLDVIANQDRLNNRFSLATLSFEGLTDGLSPLTLNGINFGDEFGGGITPTLINGDLTIETPPTPEPPTLSVEPSSSAGVVGDTIVVDLVWDGTGGMTPTYLADFDVDVSYDPSIVSFLGGIIDPEFGVDSFGCFDCAVDGSTPGTVNLFEVSFDSVLDVLANQDGLGNTFSLASLSFEGLADGLSALTLNGINFGDEFGGGFMPRLLNGNIAIGDPVHPPVPEPSTFLLLGSGLAGFAAWRMRQQRVQ